MNVNTATSALSSNINYDLYAQDDKSLVNKSSKVLGSTMLEMMEEIDSNTSKINFLLGHLNRPHSKLVEPFIKQEIIETMMPWAEQTLSLCKQLTDRGIIGENGQINLGNLNDDDIVMLTILLTQNSRSEMIRNIKEALNIKTKERDAQANENNIEQKRVTEEQSKIDLQKASRSLASKIKGILGKIFKCLAAVVGAVAAVVTAVAGSVASGGAAAAPLIVGAVFACMAAVTTLTQVGLETAAELTKNPTIQKAAFAFGVISAGLGIAGGISSVVGFVKLGGAFINTAVRVSQIISGVLSGTNMLTEGSCQIALGVMDKNIANTQRTLEDRKMQLEKLSAAIEFLEQLLKSLQENSQDMIKIFLEAEEDVSNAMKSQGDSQQNIAAQMS